MANPDEPGQLYPYYILQASVGGRHYDHAQARDLLQQISGLQGLGFRVSKANCPLAPRRKTRRGRSREDGTGLSEITRSLWHVVEGRKFKGTIECCTAKGCCETRFLQEQTAKGQASQETVSGQWKEGRKEEWPTTSARDSATELDIKFI